MICVHLHTKEGRYAARTSQSSRGAAARARTLLPVRFPYPVRAAGFLLILQCGIGGGLPMACSSRLTADRRRPDSPDQAHNRTKCAPPDGRADTGCAAGFIHPARREAGIMKPLLEISR